MGKFTFYRFLQVLSTVLLLAVTGCLAETQYASFDSFSNCDKDYTVTNDSTVIVTEERSGSGGSSSSINTCDLFFKAKGRDEHLCFEINKLEFKNLNVELNFYNSLDPTSTRPTTFFKYGEPIIVPQEFCSQGREASLRLAPTSNSASIRDVDLEIVVHNMHGITRVGNMDQDCGTTYDLDKSIISVLNRASDSPLNVTDTCQLWFRYMGVNPNYTLCLRFLRNKDNCGYTLRVFDGNKQESSPAHDYSCKNDKPQVWCSNKQAFYLEMIREAGSINEPGSMFSVEVKDGIKGQVNFPVDEPSSAFPIWAIVVIAVGVLLIIIAVIVYLVKKSKGYAVPKEQHEAHKI